MSPALQQPLDEGYGLNRKSVGGLTSASAAKAADTEARTLQESALRGETIWGRSALQIPRLRSEAVPFLISFRLWGRKALESIGQQPSSGFPRLCSGQALRLRARNPLLSDRSARRFAQDDGLVGVLKNLLVGRIKTTESQPLG